MSELGYTVVRNREWLQNHRIPWTDDHYLVHAEVYVHPEPAHRKAHVICSCDGMGSTSGCGEKVSFVELLWAAVMNLPCSDEYPKNYEEYKPIADEL